MDKIINDNYDSIVRRGKITPSTSKAEFMHKMLDEYDELMYAIEFQENNEAEELADVILVCLAYAKHYDIQIENELLYKIGKNYQRED